MECTCDTQCTNDVMIYVALIEGTTRRLLHEQPE